MAGIVFEKVSFDQFLSECKKSELLYGDADTMRKRWEAIELPARSTAHSAGYDFRMPFGFINVGQEPRTIPTGIRCKMPDNVSLWLLPRSGLGFRYGMRLENTVGLIDPDYYNAANEGHIIVRIRSEKEFRITQGDRFVQGVFVPFVTTEDDAAEGEREGGMGSTGR